MSAAESDARGFAARLRAGGPAHFFPVRHHSPACAWQLARAFRELKPRHVLIEMPGDFAALIPLLMDPILRAPAAIVAFPEAAPGEPAPPAAYWPLSATAPEYAAIREGAACGASIRFIDLWAGAREMREDAGEERPREEADSPGAPVVLTDDTALDHSTYVRALARRTGCRDLNELWDRLFESRITEPDWRGFFGDVGAWCLLARHSRARDDLLRDGTLARERCMARHLAQVLAKNETPVAVVTGGFHTPGLIDLSEPADPETSPLRPSRSYLVRFSHQRLDALAGYSAGMPSPRYYDLLHAAVQRGEVNPQQAVAEELFLDLAAQLRTRRPGLAPAVTGIVEALRHAAALARLRGMKGPLRSELFDAARASLVKDEDPRFGSPLLDELRARLIGTAIGDVPPGAGSPPLIEAARRQARSLGFTVTDSATRRRKLDIHRNPRHREASRFLHAMDLLGAELGRLEQGADYAVGVDLDALFEVWSYAWSPAVETNLIEAAADGDDVQRACTSVLRRKAARLGEQGKGRNAAEAAMLLFAAASAGVGPALMGELLTLLASEIAEDPDLFRVTQALQNLVLLWCARPVLGMTSEARLTAILGVCYRRAIFLIATIGSASREQLPNTAQALVAIRDVAEVASDVGTIEAALFTQAVDALVESQLPPLLQGVIDALAVQLGRRPPSFLAARIGGALAGAAVEAEDRVAPLVGLLMVSPAALRRMEDVVSAIDAALNSIDEAAFIQVLPHLRSAFTVLAPAETEALGALIAQRHGAAGGLPVYQPIPVSEAELNGNLVRARELVSLWQQDGLASWLPPELST
jgi:hypothetical protein